MTIVLTPATRSRRARTPRMLALFVVGALPGGGGAGVVAEPRGGDRLRRAPDRLLDVRAPPAAPAPPPPRAPTACSSSRARSSCGAPWDDVDAGRPGHAALGSDRGAGAPQSAASAGRSIPGTRREVTAQGWDRVIPLSRVRGRLADRRHRRRHPGPTPRGSSKADRARRPQPLTRRDGAGLVALASRRDALGVEAPPLGGPTRLGGHPGGGHSQRGGQTFGRAADGRSPGCGPVTARRRPRPARPDRAAR